MAKSKGKILPNGVVLENHEMATVVFLTELGYDIELIPPSRIEGLRSPDIRMLEIAWEIKTPKGSSRWTIENQFRRAVKQSSHLVFDARRLKMPSGKIIREVSKQFYHFKGIKRLMLITKQGDLVDFEK
ncbi:hypothetical protein [Lactococcus termiticola]|uniref:tRNA nuclease CdiA C-terminal domain-containing protein n=1 Tax=Lactococcus termiticola TaxID=2169526 RepID=A0A2R5HDF4_9LACT|nr:hypothetical protein [Lactococcus termiticola]GBG96099.1 hypothetical protein NtB2_00203 [Lactococcus termiticola]